MGKLILIDGNSIANRAFYALPPLSNSSGLHTNAAYGFTTMLLKLIEEEQPTHFLVAFDAGKVTFRHKDFKAYKGTRAKTPPELSEQFPVIKELLASFSIAQYELEGYEADDIIGTMTRLADESGMETLVVTGDKDMLQLASGQVTIALTRKGISEVERFGVEEIKDKYGLTPVQITDLKGLMGDSSDNIPGIPGVGEKTALKLLHEYETVENVLAHAEDLKGKMKEKVSQHAEDARMSKELATIFRDVPMDTDWDKLSYHGFDRPTLAAMFRKLEFKSLLERLELSGESSLEAGQEEEEEELELRMLDRERLGELTGQLGQIVSMHLEAPGGNPHQAQTLGLALYDGQVCWYAPAGLLKEEAEGAAKPVLDWLAQASAAKTVYDSHKTELALHWQGHLFRGAEFDLLLAAYLLDPTDSNLTFSGIAAKYGGLAVPAEEEVYGKGAKFKVPEPEAVMAYAGRKAAAIHRLAPMLKERLEDNGMGRLYYELEHPLSKVLAKSELTGIKVDAADLERYGEELSREIEQLERRIHELAGTSFNIGSPKQLGEILFEKLGLPTVKKTKTGYSTDAEVLERLEPHHEIVGLIVHYRQLAKLKGTYVEGLLKEIRPETGKIHTYYHQTIAATGRLSSQFPNLQNIPIRLEEGRKIRKVFVPSEPGWLILAADYSQIELRVLAHISRDENLIEAFRNEMDIHTKTAMDVFGVSEEQVDANMRRQAKAVNFGIVYGISDYGLSQNLHITRAEAAAFIQQYFSVFQGVKRYMEDIVAEARQQGYVSTLLQRRRYLPEITSSNFNIRSFAERTAMNTPIQGTAADIIKLAMVQMAERLEREKLRSRMLLQVHDELVFEVPEEELPIMTELVPQVMEKALEMNVPLRADVSYGTNWYEAK